MRRERAEQLAIDFGQGVEQCPPRRVWDGQRWSVRRGVQLVGQVERVAPALVQPGGGVAVPAAAGGVAGVASHNGPLAGHLCRGSQQIGDSLFRNAL